MSHIVTPGPKAYSMARCRGSCAPCLFQVSSTVWNCNKGMTDMVAVKRSRSSQYFLNAIDIPQCTISSLHAHRIPSVIANRIIRVSNTWSTFGFSAECAGDMPFSSGTILGESKCDTNFRMPSLDRSVNKIFRTTSVSPLEGRLIS